MKKLAKKRRRTKSFFRPDAISTLIAEDMMRDLEAPLLAYGAHEYALVPFLEIQKKSILKKYRSLENSDGNVKCKLTAIEKFMEVNEHMKAYTADGKLNLPELKADTHYRSQVLRTARMIVRSILTPLEEDEWFYRCKNSSGVSQGVRFSNTEIEGKFTYPISGSERVKLLCYRYSQYNPRLTEAIIDYNRLAGSPSPEYTVSNSSHVTTVPKNNETDRMIAIEPTWDMFFQQGLMECMYHRLADCGLDVRILPEIQKERALKGSITGDLSTIDFSSASDCISIDLVKWLLPPTWFHRCDMVRSSKMDHDGSLVDLAMFSTMGNAVTFPLETLIFYSMAVAVVHHDSLKPGHKLGLLPSLLSKSKVTVFGDDCILPTENAANFISITEIVGFIVNKDKSCYDPFPGYRESGGDYNRGFDVRPMSIKAPTSTAMSALEPWLYSTYNKIIPLLVKVRGERNYLYESSVLTRLWQLCSSNKIKIKVVPNYFPDDAGLKIYHDIDRFRACYPQAIFSKIAVSDQGWFKFNYCRFNYRVSELKSPDLRYAERLRELSLRLSRHSVAAVLSERFKVRRNGGYVVAKTTVQSFVKSFPNTKL